MNFKVALVNANMMIVKGSPLPLTIIFIDPVKGVYCRCSATGEEYYIKPCQLGKKPRLYTTEPLSYSGINPSHRDEPILIRLSHYFKALVRRI